MATRNFYLRFKGGPDDGRELEVATPPPLPAVWSDAGSFYRRGPITATSGRTAKAPLVYTYDAEATKLAAPGLSGLAAAWTRLMRALGVAAPKDLRRMRNATAEIRRLTRQHR